MQLKKLLYTYCLPVIANYEREVSGVACYSPLAPAADVTRHSMMRQATVQIISEGILIASLLGKLDGMSDTVMG